MGAVGDVRTHRYDVGMITWPIKRTWRATQETNPSDFETSEISEFRACVLLGSAGIGKTYEVQQLKSHEQSLFADVRYKRLATLATSNDALERRLSQLAA